MSLLRRRKVPEAVRAVPLVPGERRVGWAVTVDGTPVVASDLGLWISAGERVDWADIERAGWQRPVLTVTRMTERAGSGRKQVITLDDDDGDLPDIVRTRVTASVAWSSHRRLHPSGGVRVVGRRRPGRDLLEWQLTYDADTDMSDPAIRLQAEQMLEAARRTIG